MFLGRNEILFYNTGPNKSINNKQYPPISNIFLSQNIANNVKKIEITMSQIFVGWFKIRWIDIFWTKRNWERYFLDETNF